MVNVIDEDVEGVDTLFESAFYPVPFSGINNPRDQVKGKDFRNK